MLDADFRRLQYFNDSNITAEIVFTIKNSKTGSKHNIFLTFELTAGTIVGIERVEMPTAKNNDIEPEPPSVASEPEDWQFDTAAPSWKDTHKTPLTVAAIAGGIVLAAILGFIAGRKKKKAAARPRNIRKIIAIGIFSLFIALFFALYLSVPIYSLLRDYYYFREYGKTIIGGFSLILHTIPVLLIILLKKSIKKRAMLYFAAYFCIMDIINIVSWYYLPEILLYHDYRSFDITRHIDNIREFLFVPVFLTLQLPLVLLCFIIRRLKRYDAKLTFKYFVKEPLLYIFIVSLVLCPLVFSLVVMLF